MNLGVSSYTWVWAVGIKGYMPENPLDIINLLEKANSVGVKVVQIADNIPLNKMSDVELNKIITIAKEYSIKLEVGMLGIKPDNLYQYLQIAKKLKSSLVRTIFQSLNSKAVSLIKKVLPQYEEANIYIGIENHGEYKSVELAGFIDKVGSGHVGVCLDTVNSFAALELPETVVKVLAPYTINLHIKDFDIVRSNHKAGFSIEGRPAGKGRLNIAWIIDYLKSNGKNPNAILELWTPFAGTIEETIQKEDEWALDSIKFLKKIIS